MRCDNIYCQLPLSQNTNGYICNQNKYLAFTILKKVYILDVTYFFFFFRVISSIPWMTDPEPKYFHNDIIFASNFSIPSFCSRLWLTGAFFIIAVTNLDHSMVRSKHLSSALPKCRTRQPILKKKIPVDHNIMFTNLVYGILIHLYLRAILIYMCATLIYMWATIFSKRLPKRQPVVSVTPSIVESCFINRYIL